MLRSKTPALVRQEFWGLVLAHFAIRQLMVQAAWPRKLDPDQLSFTHAARVIKRKLPQAAAIPPLSACHSGAMPCSKRSRAVASSAAADGAIRAA